MGMLCRQPGHPKLPVGIPFGAGANACPDQSFGYAGILQKRASRPVSITMQKCLIIQCGQAPL